MAARSGIRFGDLLEREAFEEKLKFSLDYQNAVLTKVYGEAPIDFATVRDQYLDFAEKLRPYASDTIDLLHDALTSGKRVIYEGAQGALLDLDHGTFPYVTSSTTMSGGAGS